MKVHTNQLGTRIVGTLTGVSFLAVGVFTLLAGGPDLTDVERERASGFGWVAIIGGVWALGVSWLDSDLRGVWCRPPKRWWQ